MSRLDFGSAGVVASFVVGADCCRVRVLRDTRHAVREVVEESHDPGVGSFGLFGTVDRCGLVEVATSNHVAFAGRRCALACSTLFSAIPSHICSVLTRPTFPVADDMTVFGLMHESETLVLIAAAHVGSKPLGVRQVLPPSRDHIACAAGVDRVDQTQNPVNLGRVVH